MFGDIWPFSKINFQPNLEAYCCVIVSAKKFRQAKKRCLARIVNFFPKKYFAKFSKVVFTEYIDYNRNAKNHPKKPPIIF